MFTTFPREALAGTIPQRFHEMVARHPHRPAVRWDGVELEYVELRERVRRAAAGVRAAAPPAPCAVALLVPQGVELVVAILAVLEAGHWYVPLDPAEEPPRLGELLAFSEARLVLAGPATIGAAREAAAGRCAVARVDHLEPAEPGGSFEPPADPDALAYVYFTSGTTGAPKGVVDTHRNVLHNVLRYTNALRLTAHDRLTLVQAAHFSGAVSNVFGALLNGACLLPYDVARDGPGAPLARWMAHVRPTIYHSVPSLFRSACLPGAHFPSVRVVRLEGDAGVPADAERFARHFPPGSALAHGLGATETGLSRQYLVPHGAHVPGDVLPIGYAVEDVEVELRDESGAPVPPGEAGEIVVRSRYLSPGYWRDPGRTAAAFRSDASDPALREYASGDLGRLRTDGCLEHLGRRDQQVRVRGLWVDAAAVESAIAGLPGIAESAVAPLRAPGGEADLAAFLVARDGAALPTLRELRAALGTRLPAHALPARAFALDALPLGAHGKLDRRALSPSLGRPLPSGSGGDPPRDATEAALVEVWREALAGVTPGIHDAFVELGGDSLKAVQVALAVERRFGITLPPGALAETPTIAALATRLRTGPEAAGGARGALLTVRTGGGRPPLFCVHDLESDPFLFSALARRLEPGRAVHALRHPAGGQARSVPRAIPALAAHYLEEVARAAPRGPYHLAGFCFGGVVALEMARQLRARGERVATLALLNVTAYDLPALVSPAARARFRRHWPARVRYLRAKRDAARWIARRVGRALEDLAWRAWLPVRLAPSGGAEPASPALVRAALRDAFRRHVARPDPGDVLLFLAEETLPLYTDDPREAWAGLAGGRVELVRLPRDGYAMLTEPDVAVVAGRLDAWMSRDARPSPSREPIAGALPA